MIDRRLRFDATSSTGEVSARLQVPDGAHALYVLAHGAGAGMEHAFMEAMADALVRQGVATFRFNFPYTEAGRRAPNPHPILKKTIRSAVAHARDAAPDLPLVAGGKSMGGRMTSLAQSEEPIAGVVGLAFLGFPLHAPGKRGAERGTHLADVDVPMLFLQGTRDRLADLDLLRPLLADVGPRAHLHVVEGGDHSFKLPKRLGRAAEDVFEELAQTVAGWAERV